MKTRIDPTGDKLIPSALNSSVSTSRIIKWLPVCVFILSFLTFMAPHVIRRDLGAPPEVGDPPNYDAIALRLSQGKGFSVNWDDPTFRAPYLNQDTTGTYSFLYDWHGEGPTAYRPPLFPLLMAASYRLFGRHFAPVRVMNILFIAMTVGLACWLIARRFGAIPGLLCTALLVFVDYRLRYYASFILTEGLACLLATAMLWALLRTLETRSRKWAGILGVMTALAFLDRTIFVFWVPPIAITVFLLTRSRNQRWLGIDSLRLPFIFAAVFLIVALPWMIRNCVVLHRFEPLGTQGSINLISGYSYKALEFRGVWYNPDGFGFFDKLPLEGKTPIEQERLKADLSRAEAMQWMVRNPLKIPRLAVLKAVNEWMPQSLLQMVLLGFAAIGFLVLLLQTRYEAAAYFCLLASATLAIAATYGAGGRFLIPFIPMLAMLASLGLWSFILVSAELPLERIRLSHLETELGEPRRKAEA
jgi:4-amino-4-deoxy-L-arabinose transferase-like glycosyltransferase